MSIASELSALQTDITNARTAITNKGGTVTSGGGSSQLATDIATIPTSGIVPTGNINITTTNQSRTLFCGVCNIEHDLHEYEFEGRVKKSCCGQGCVIL